MSNLMLHSERFTRSRDVDTSHDAAIIGAEKWTDLLHNVYSIIYDLGPVTHDEIVTAYELRNHPRVTPQRIRTAVHSLVLGGSKDFDRVVSFPPAVRRAEGFGLTPFGRRSQKWEAIQPKRFKVDADNLAVLDTETGLLALFASLGSAVNAAAHLNRDPGHAEWFSWTAEVSA
jgi:hypothetical protein